MLACLRACLVGGFGGEARRGDKKISLGGARNSDPGPLLVAADARQQASIIVPPIEHNSGARRRVVMGWSLGKENSNTGEFKV